MTDLRQQITEALDEAERAAIQVSYGMSLTRASEWCAEFADEPDPDGGWRKRWAVLSGTQLVARCPEVSPRFSTFIARWDPATALRLVAYGRKVLARHERDDDGSCIQCWTTRDDAIWPCADVIDLAAFWLGQDTIWVDG